MVTSHLCEIFLNLFTHSKLLITICRFRSCIPDATRLRMGQPIDAMFNIIARPTLLAYCKKYPSAANALKQWYAELHERDFASFNELKSVYGSVSVVADDRAVFNIMGNKYRLVVRMVFDYKTIQIKWFGTHAEYDKIDVTTVQYQNQKP